MGCEKRVFRNNQIRFDTASGDSGNNCTALSGVHADNHSWAFFPQPAPAPSIVFCGNDGGLYRSTNGSRQAGRHRLDLHRRREG